MGLKEFRESMGITQEDLAASANISQSMVQAIESGRRKGSFSTLKEIASSLGISMDELFRAIDNTQSTKEEQR